jgi:hypothetical protein
LKRVMVTIHWRKFCKISLNLKRITLSLFINNEKNMSDEYKWKITKQNLRNRLKSVNSQRRIFTNIGISRCFHSCLD